MFNYPLLSSSDQASLPLLTAAPVKLAAKFEDSTHQLWYCDTVDGPTVLKVCDTTSLASSPFWHGVNTLFGLDFPHQLSDASATATLLNANGNFQVPEVITAKDNHFVLTRFLPGVDVETAQVNDVDVEQLAQHIGRLHQLRSEQWGDLHAPEFTAEQWRLRLINTLEALAKQSDLEISPSMLTDILVQAAQTEAIDFVPIMPDLRWDQFRRLEGTQDLALIDLDAFVIGPRALELVLLMYLLTPAQLAVFKRHYCELNTWPDMRHALRAYQFLLFLMHVLGETNLDRWMQRI